MQCCNTRYGKRATHNSACIQPREGVNRFWKKKKKSARKKKMESAHTKRSLAMRERPLTNNKIEKREKMLSDAVEGKRGGGRENETRTWEIPCQSCCGGGGGVWGERVGGGGGGGGV